MIFQDAVQTLIDAVQELIQTHEAFEEESGAKDAKESKTDEGPTDKLNSEASVDSKPVKEFEGVHTDAGDVGENLTLGGQVGGNSSLGGHVGGVVGGQVEGLTEEVWTSLRKEYPGAEFVVVTDQ